MHAPSLADVSSTSKQKVCRQLSLPTATTSKSVETNAPLTLICPQQGRQSATLSHWSRHTPSPNMLSQHLRCSKVLGQALDRPINWLSSMTVSSQTNMKTPAVVARSSSPRPELVKFTSSPRSDSSWQASRAMEPLMSTTSAFQERATEAGQPFGLSTLACTRDGIAWT